MYVHFMEMTLFVLAPFYFQKWYRLESPISIPKMTNAMTNGFSEAPRGLQMFMDRFIQK